MRVSNMNERERRARPRWATTRRFPGRGAHVIECTPDACRVVPIPKSQGG
eukprot:COSAG02_NODE_41149_length_397_cov_1.486577_1_plen_49_part_01